MDIKRLLEHKFLLFVVIMSTCVITWGSLGRINSPVTIEGSDKVAHFIIYFVYATIWFLFLYLSHKMNKNLLQAIVLTFLVCFLFGLLMEYLQVTLTTYRGFEWNDVAANSSGIIIALLIFLLFKNKLKEFKQSYQIIR